MKFLINTIQKDSKLQLLTLAFGSFFLIALYAANDAVPAPMRRYWACSGYSGTGGAAGVVLSSSLTIEKDKRINKCVFIKQESLKSSPAVKINWLRELQWY